MIKEGSGRKRVFLSSVLMGKQITPNHTGDPKPSKPPHNCPGRGGTWGCYEGRFEQDGLARGRAGRPRLLGHRRQGRKEGGKEGRRAHGLKLGGKKSKEACAVKKRGGGDRLFLPELGRRARKGGGGTFFFKVLLHESIWEGNFT